MTAHLLFSASPRIERRWAAKAESVGSFIAFVCLSFLFIDAGIKLLRLSPAVEGTVRLGYSDSVIVPLGLVLLGATVLTAIARTRVLGAIMLTGYLGGATASHVHAGQPFFFPVVFGVLVWLSIWLRDERLRQLLR
jgi:hypothetical protein